jgi:hypothetical protein
MTQSATAPASNTKYSTLKINFSVSHVSGFAADINSLDPEAFIRFTAHALERSHAKILGFEVLQAFPFVVLQPVGVICNGEQQMSSSAMEAEYRLEAESMGLAITQQGFALFCIKQMTGIQITNA